MMETTIRPIAEGRSTNVNLNVIAITDCECAVILSVIHDWMQNDCTEYDGKKWIHCTLEKFSEILPFQRSTIKRRLNRLRDEGILLTKNLNEYKFDKSLWYSIDYERLNNIIADSCEGQV